jgi:hypothetical protein
MDYCNKCDIVHEYRICPLCEAMKEIEELKKRIEELENQLD